MNKSVVAVVLCISSVNGSGQLSCNAEVAASTSALVQTKRPLVKAVQVAATVTNERPSKAARPLPSFPHVAKVKHSEETTPANFRPDSLMVWPTLSVAFTLCTAVALVAMTVKDKVPVPAFQRQRGYQRCTKSLSTWDGTMCILSGVMGVGVLSMPYVFSRAGLIAAPLILLVVVCSAYTAHLLVWALQAQPLWLPAGDKGIARDFFLERACEASRSNLYTWGSLVENAFGPRACIAANIFLALETWGYLLSYIVGASMNISQIFGDEKSRHAAVLISTAFAYVLASPRGALNVISNAVYLCCFVMLVLSGILLPEHAAWSELKTCDAQGLFSVSGILVFSPAAHAFFPDIQRRMRHPELFPLCLKGAYAVAAIFYLSVGLAGYLLFGSAVQPSAIQNVGWTLDFQPLPRMHWLAVASAAGMAIRLLVMQAFVLPTLTSSLQGLLGNRDPAASPPGSLLPCVLAASAGVAAFFSAQVALLLNFLGGAICAHIAFTMPVLCYWKLSRQSRRLPWSEQLGLALLFLMGCCFSVMGTLSFLWSGAFDGI